MHFICEIPSLLVFQSKMMAKSRHNPELPIFSIVRNNLLCIRFENSSSSPFFLIRHFGTSEYHCFYDSRFPRPNHWSLESTTGSLAEDCSLIFNEALDYRWTYRKTLCGTDLMNADVVITGALTIAMGCLDLFAYVRHLAYRKVSKKQFPLWYFLELKISNILYWLGCSVLLVLIKSFVFPPLLVSNHALASNVSVANQTFKFRL